MEVLYAIKSPGDRDSPGADSTQTRAQDTDLIHTAPGPGPFYQLYYENITTA